MKARYFSLLLVALVCCSACGAPSLRHKKEINKLLAQGEYLVASNQLEAAKNKEYKAKDALLYYLDNGAVYHDSGLVAESDELLDLAQKRIDELFTQSVSGHAGRYLINDLTIPYYPAPFEQALTYYYRAMNFLSRGYVNSALVEANKAVYYLAQLRGSKSGGYRDDPFVQYFASLIFESAGKLDDARISRTRAYQAYQNSGKKDLAETFVFDKPVEGWGEVVLVHANGQVPLKKSKTFQVLWADIIIWGRSLRKLHYLDVETNRNTESADDGMFTIEMENAVLAGLVPNSLTISYPVLEAQNYEIKSSEAVTADGRVHPTRLVGDIEGAIQADLEEKRIPTFVRAGARAIVKKIAAEQAGKAMQEATEDANIGELTTMILNFLGALTERADTRQWFTLPAQMRLTRFYVAPGRQDIVLRFKDGFGNIISEHTFQNVLIRPNGRVYLHYRTAK